MTVATGPQAREKVAFHAAGRTIVLLNKFNQKAAWAGGTPEVCIRPFNPADDSYTTSVKVTLAQPATNDDYWQEKFKERDAIVRDLALAIAGDVAEQVAFGRNEAKKAETLHRAHFLAENDIYSSLAFLNGASQEDISGIAQDAFALATSLIENQRQEFDNLAQVFKTQNRLTGMENILQAARTGLLPQP